MLTGPTAIAFCKGDAAAVAKKLSDVARETRILRAQGRRRRGQPLDEDGVKRLATLPSREVAERARSSASSRRRCTGLVTLLAAAPREFVVVLDQIIQKKQAEAA